MAMHNEWCKLSCSECLRLCDGHLWLFCTAGSRRLAQCISRIAPLRAVISTFLLLQTSSCSRESLFGVPTDAFALAINDVLNVGVYSSGKPFRDCHTHIGCSRNKEDSSQMYALMSRSTSNLRDLMTREGKRNYTQHVTFCCVLTCPILYLAVTSKFMLISPCQSSLVLLTWVFNESCIRVIQIMLFICFWKCRNRVLHAVARAKPCLYSSFLICSTDLC
jgi:hypothetical protein